LLGWTRIDYAEEIKKQTGVEIYKTSDSELRKALEIESGI